MVSPNRKLVRNIYQADIFNRQKVFNDNMRNIPKKHVNSKIHLDNKKVYVRKHKPQNYRH